MAGNEVWAWTIARRRARVRRFGVRFTLREKVCGAIPAGRTSATKKGVRLTSASIVLVTLQADVAGVAVRPAVPDLAGHSFTLHLAKAVTVGWFIVN